MPMVDPIRSRIVRHVPRHGVTSIRDMGSPAGLRNKELALQESPMAPALGPDFRGGNCGWAPIQSARILSVECEEQAREEWTDQKTAWTSQSVFAVAPCRILRVAATAKKDAFFRWPLSVCHASEDSDAASGSMGILSEILFACSHHEQTAEENSLVATAIGAERVAAEGTA